MSTITNICIERLNELNASQRRFLRDCEPVSPVQVRVDGKNYLSFAGNDYLGLRMHPAVVDAGVNVATHYGAGSGASRLVTGNHPLYGPLEAALAEYKHTEAALVFGSGYLANIGVVASLMGEGDLILADKLVHACILDGARLSGATLKRFKHNDAAHAQTLLQAHRSAYRHVLIVTESIFSMDGDRAPLVELSKLAREHHAWLMVDDAHGLGEDYEVQPDIWVGTLSKAIGGYGGYVAASNPVIDLLTNHARSLIFSTGLPPAVCASALAALRFMKAEPERADKASNHARHFTKELGLSLAESAIVPLITGSAESALALSEKLKTHGIWATAIRPPTVPANTARLRLTFSAEHSDEEVQALISAIKAAQKDAI